MSETLLGVSNGNHIYTVYIYSMSNLTFVAQAQNYEKKVEFSTDHLLSIQKLNYKAGNAFV